MATVYTKSRIKKRLTGAEPTVSRAGRCIIATRKELENASAQKRD